MDQNASPHSWARANFLWIGSQLSPVEVLTLKSYINTGWLVTLYTYGEVEGVPEGCVVRDGRTILDDALIFTNEETVAPGVSYSDFADLFRWRLLSIEPGWWFDMDMVSLKPPRPLQDNAPMRFGSTWEHEWGQCAINCVMYTDGTSGVFAEAFQRSLDIVNRSECEYLKIGPFILQDIVREKSLERFVAPWWEFCPYPWRQIRGLCSRTAREHYLNRLRVVKHSIGAMFGSLIRPSRVRSGTLAVHLHNEVWRKGGLGKNGPFFRHSFLARQLRKHGVPGATIV